jgi:hypothetical protein
MSERRISGRVVHRGAGLEECQVLAADTAAGAVVADAETGSGGEWELTVPGERELLAVARCRGEAIGLATAPVADGGPVELDVGATHDLTIRLEGDELPDWARPIVQLMPLHLDGRDDTLLRWITAPVRQISGSPLARITAHDRKLVRALQPGTWWITARAEHVPDARTPDMPSDLRLATVRATAAGRELPAARGGYTFALDGPLEVVLTLASPR